jgi:hypothetical protein
MAARVMHAGRRSCGGVICVQIKRFKNRQGYEKLSRAVRGRMRVNLVLEAISSLAGQVLEPVVI